MSKGSKVVPIRMPDELLREIMQELSSRKDAGKLRPINLSTWVRQAIREKIAHARRSRVRPKKKLLDDAFYEEVAKIRDNPQT